MNSKFQQSIARARAKIAEANRLAAKMVRDIKADKERANTNLELLIDDIVAETAIPLTTENLPLIAFYVEQFVKDQQKEPDGDVDGMKDYPL